jgi:hypothetical protein
VSFFETTITHVFKPEFFSLYAILRGLNILDLTGRTAALKINLSHDHAA